MNRPPPPYGSYPPPSSNGGAWPTTPSAVSPQIAPQPQGPSYGPPPVQQAQSYGPPPAGGFGPSPSYAPPPAYYGYAPPPAYGAYGQPVIQNAAEPPVGTGAPSLRWVVFGSFAASLLFGVIGTAIGVAADGSDPGMTIGSIFTMLSMPLIGVYFIAALVWLYKSWEMIPPHLRVTGNGTRVTPGSAVGFLFIPFYNMYWYFIASAGLCTALNRVLESYGSPKRASRGLGITAAIFQLIPYVNLFLGPFIWLAFMFSVESAKREYARVASAGQAPRMV
jgi:hypothetical protein